MKKLRYLLFAFLAGITMQGNAQEAAKTKTFDQDQTKQIQQIVHDYVVNNPSILVEASQKLQEQEAEKEKVQIEQIKVNAVKYKKEIFDLKAAGRIITGNPNGKTIIAEFTQYQCPHCKTITPIIDKLLKDNPDTQLITIYWPFFGNDATYASKTALAAQKQNKFNELNRAMLATSDFLINGEIDSFINATLGLDA